MRGFCAGFEDCRALETVEAFSLDRKELRCWVGCVVIVESASLRDGIPSTANLSRSEIS